jgi:hypothetical protein
VSTPDENKFDLEDLNLSGDLSDLPQPLADAGNEPLLSEPKPLDEAKVEESGEELLPVDEQPAEEIDETDVIEQVADAGTAPTQPKFKVLIQRLKTANPYTVMLSIAVAALLIAILCCLIELGRYGFDLGAKGAKVSVSTVATVESLENA